MAVKGLPINTKDIEGIMTVGSNAKNTVNNVNAADGVFDGETTFLDTSVSTQSISSTVITGVETAGVVASSSAKSAPQIFSKAAPLLGKTNIVLVGWGAGNDTATIINDYKNPEELVKASSALSLASNVMAGLATGAVVTGVGAPVAVVLGGASIVLWGASVLVDSDLSLKDAVTPRLDVMNDAVVHGLGDMGTAASRAILGFLDPEEELPEISGSQQNQLMAISKTPSFNYTSHKKDSVAGYNLYQMLDNAEDTISSSSMNGFTVYVMGKTIQPTCMGDEAGIGGGVKSGTVGKEVRATSGAPSIFYCGYMSIRADDTCTMNNENVEGKYISLC